MKVKVNSIMSALLIITLLFGLAPPAFLTASAAAGDGELELVTTVYEHRFESNPFEEGWETEDGDGDGYKWEYFGDTSYYHNSRGVIGSRSAAPGGQPLDPRNVIYTPGINIPDEGETVVSLWASGFASSVYDEHFRIGFCFESQPDTLNLLGSGDFVTDEYWRQFSVTLPESTKGRKVRIFIRHHNSYDRLRLCVDDLSVTNTLKIPKPAFSNYAYKFDFEDNPFSHNWRHKDLDGDGYSWEHIGDSEIAHSGSGAASSASYINSTDLEPRNDLISPSIRVPSTGVNVIGVWARGFDTNDYDECFRFFYNAGDGDTWLGNLRITTNYWRYYSVVLPDHLNGKESIFGIEHYKTRGKFALYVDDFELINYTSYPKGTIYANNFETDPFKNGWGKADMDGDGHGWKYNGSRNDAYSGTGVVWSASHEPGVGPLSPNNRLISPAIEIPAAGVTTIKVMARGDYHIDFAEHFIFSYVIEGEDPIPTIFGNTTDEWREYSVIISPDDPVRSKLLGKKLRIVITHWKCTDQMRLLIDDFTVTNSSGALKGDFNRNGKIEVDDALAALRIAAKLAEASGDDLLIGDIDGNGKIEVDDALAILRVAARLADPSSL